MATIIPNRAGEALQRSSENLINLILQVNRLKLDRDQLEEQARQFDEQLAYLKAGRPFGFIQDIIQRNPGARIGDLPIPQEMWEQAGLEFDPDAVLTPETIESLGNKLAVRAIQSGGPNDPTYQRFLNGILTGDARPDAALALDDIITGTRFDIAREHILSMTPREQRLIYEDTFGLPQSSQFTFNGQEFFIESGQTGQLILAFMNMQLAQAEAERLGNDQMLQYREAFKTRVEQIGVENFGVSPVQARQTVEEVLNGVYTDEASVAAITNPNKKAFVTYLLAGQDKADMDILEIWNNTQEGQLLSLIEQTAEQLGSIPGIDEKTSLKFLQSVTEAISEMTGIPLPRIERARTLRHPIAGEYRLTFPSSQSQGTQPAPGDTTAGPGASGPPIVTNNPAAPLNLGTPDNRRLSAPGVIDLTREPDMTIPIPEDLQDDPAAVEAIRLGVDPDFIRMIKQPVPEPDR